MGPTVLPVRRLSFRGKVLPRTGRTTIRSPSLPYPQDGLTAPLRILAMNGHEGVVKIVLEREEDNRNERGNDGRILLLVAGESSVQT